MSEIEIKYVSYYEVNEALKKFYRVNVRLLSLKDQEMQIFKDQTYVIRSDYNMLHMKYQIDNNVLLAGFVYQKKGEKYAKMYPLPESLAVFSEDALKLKLNFMSEEERKQRVAESPVIVEKKQILERLKNQITDSLKKREENMQSQINLAKVLPKSIFYTTESLPQYSEAEDDTDWGVFFSHSAQKPNPPKSTNEKLFTTQHQRKLEKTMKKFLSS